jgi:flagellar protein FlgJ
MSIRPAGPGTTPGAALGAPIGAAPGAPFGAPIDREAKLRETAVQLEGMFVAQLYQAMRTTIPDDGLIAGGSGEAMFTGLMDEHLAAETPKGWGGHGLAEALVRQLRGLGPAPEAAP